MGDVDRSDTKKPESLSLFKSIFENDESSDSDSEESEESETEIITNVSNDNEIKPMISAMPSTESLQLSSNTVIPTTQNIQHKMDVIEDDIDNVNDDDSITPRQR